VLDGRLTCVEVRDEIGCQGFIWLVVPGRVALLDRVDDAFDVNVLVQLVHGGRGGGKLLEHDVFVGDKGRIVPYDLHTLHYGLISQQVMRRILRGAQLHVMVVHVARQHSPRELRNFQPPWTLTFRLELLGHRWDNHSHVPVPRH